MVLVFGIYACAWCAPEMVVELRGDFEDDELVCLGGELVLVVEFGEFVVDRDERIGRCLVGEVVEFWVADRWCVVAELVVRDL